MNIQDAVQELYGYVQTLTEASKASKYSTAQEFMPSIEKVIKKHFPKSTVQLRFSKSLNNVDGDIYIYFAVAGDKSEITGKLWDNDMAETKILIWGMDREGKFKDKLRFDPAIGGKVRVKTTDSRMRAYDSVKVGLRKKTGTPEQVLKHIDNYFKKLLAAFKANQDKLPDDHLALLKKKGYV